MSEVVSTVTPCPPRLACTSATVAFEPPLLEMALRAVGEAGLASAAAGEEEDDDDESSPMRATASEVSTLAANTTPAKGDADGVELAESGELRTP